MDGKNSLQQKVWDYIRRNPNFRVGDILMLIPISKSGLRHYLIALRKAAYIRKETTKKQNRGIEDDMYALIKKVGVYAPKINKTALFDPNTKETYGLSASAIKSVRDGGYRHYSLLLGRPTKFLSYYKSINPHLSSAQECYNDYLAKQKESDELIKKVQFIYTFLKEKREVVEFGKYLCKQGIFEKEGTYITALRSIYKKSRGLLPIRAIENYKAIIKGFEEQDIYIKTVKERS